MSTMEFSRTSPQKKAGEFAIEYDSRNHFAIISSMRGSVWPHVFKYCVINVVWTLFARYVIEVKYDAALNMTGKGHSLMTIMVSFLLVQRVNLALAHYNEARANLGGMLRSTRDLVAIMAIGSKDDQTQGAKQWRSHVAYYTCLMLRLMVAASDYKSDGKTPWTIPELHGEIKEELLKHNQITGYSAKFAHERRTEKEEVYRVPITMCHFLRIAIADNNKYLAQPLTEKAKDKLNGIVDKINHAYVSQKKVYTTPPPFPMVQMSRTLTFVWVFLVPLVLMADDSSIFVHCFVVFFITFAFIGLEYVAMEVDDPFGDDANDFDDVGLARSVFEDVYNIINLVDGEEWAYKVRFNMKGTESEEFLRPSELTPLNRKFNGNGPV